MILFQRCQFIAFHHLFLHYICPVTVICFTEYLIRTVTFRIIVFYHILVNEVNYRNNFGKITSLHNTKYFREDNIFTYLPPDYTT